MVFVPHYAPATHRRRASRARRARTAAIRCIAFARLFARARGDDRDALVVAALADASSRLRDLSVAQVRKGALKASGQANSES